MAICPALPASIWASGHKPSHERLVHTPTLIAKHGKYSWMNVRVCVCMQKCLKKNKKIILYLIINLLQNQSSCRAISNEKKYTRCPPHRKHTSRIMPVYLHIVYVHTNLYMSLCVAMCELRNLAAFSVSSPDPQAGHIPKWPGTLSDNYYISLPSGFSAALVLKIITVEHYTAKPN